MAGQIDTAIVSAGALGQGRAKRARVTVGTSAVTVVPPAGPWGYLKVSNRTADTWVAVAINEDPTNEGTSPPDSVDDWGVGYDVLGGASELIPLAGTVTTVRLLASAADTAVVLDFVK